MPQAFKDHGKAILETAKDHLAAALDQAPAGGWTAVEWAEAAGLLLDGAAFPAVVAHHLGPVLAQEGRARITDAGGLPRFAPAERRAAPADPPGAGEGSARAAATSSPQLWSGAPAEEVFVDGSAAPAGAGGGPEDEGQKPPPGHHGPWIP
jgi:hypothetical protein